MAEKSCGAAQPATDTIATSPVASVLDRNRDERFVGKELVSSNLRSLRERVAALDVLEPGGRGWAVPASVFRDGVLDLIDEAIESAGETTGGPDKRDDELLHLRRQMGEIAVLLLQNDRDEVMEWARGVKLHFPDGAPELVAESPAETPARHMEKCTFGGSYGWCELELGHDGPHSIPKPVKSTGEPA
jgi:hypothetical protein